MNEVPKLIATPTRTVSIMRQYDIKMKKSLGQNFLVEPQILEQMVKAAEINQETTVIEIGPGIGALTEYLAQRAKQVVAFEIDPRFVAILSDTLASYSNIKVHHQDILKVDFSDEVYADLRECQRLVVVANLPYYITTPIIMHLVHANLAFDKLVMMMQKEVAERMTASIGTKQYGSLTLAIENTMFAQIAFNVPKTVFIPKPNVDSAVLVLSRRPAPLFTLEDSAHFERFVQAAFQQRRKTLWNNLKAYLKQELFGMEPDQLQNLLDQVGIKADRRAETLSLAEFVALYRILHAQYNY